MYSHPSALVFVSPVGIVSRYLYGIMYNPFDLKMAIIDSKQNKSRSTVDSMLLFCYNYDPTEKGYVIQAVNNENCMSLYSCSFFLVLYRI